VHVNAGGVDNPPQGMAVPAGYVQALVDYAEAINDITVLEKERDALYERIKAGETGALINSTIAGKTFGFAPTQMSVEEKFTAFVQAVNEAKGTRITTTFADFSCIQR
jgi:hypothetical protein